MSTGVVITLIICGTIVLLVGMFLIALVAAYRKTSNFVKNETKKHNNYFKEDRW
jgi:heme/copper-type cytochrome/quinol oxidase subunit 2